MLGSKEVAKIEYDLSRLLPLWKKFEMRIEELSPAEMLIS